MQALVSRSVIWDEVKSTQTTFDHEERFTYIDSLRKSL